MGAFGRGSRRGQGASPAGNGQGAGPPVHRSPSFRLHTHTHIWEGWEGRFSKAKFPGFIYFFLVISLIQISETEKFASSKLPKVKMDYIQDIKQNIKQGKFMFWGN